VAINKALEKAENVNNSEMGGLAQGMMPNLFG
jgi:DNA-binding protein YbaB